MNKLSVILISMIFVAACSQMTTNKSELAALQSTADNLGDVYVGCVLKNSVASASKNAIDVASVVKISAGLCQTDLDQFKNAQTEYLSSQFMMTEKPLQASVDSLNDRAMTEVAEALLAAAETQPTAIAPVAVSTAAVAGARAAATSSVAAQPASAGWTAEQRIYLDCMEDQSRKYSGLNETATVIADVAQSRCKSYMAGPGAAALEQEGRTLVMGAVLDAKLQGPGRQPNN